MKIFVTTGQTEHEKELFQEMLNNHDWLNGEWDRVRRVFVFEENNNLDQVTSEIHDQASGWGIRIRIETE